jgi:N-acetylneuraminate synthase
MEINGRKIGLKYPPYIIAEMSNNHMNDINKAYRIIELAKKNGADAIKIQTYTADSLTIDCDKPDFVIPDPLWKGKTYYELYKEITMPLEWNRLLFQKAKDVGITIFSSPFDEASVDLLEELNCPAYKIASFEAKDHRFLRKIASTKKPIVMSTGVSTLNDVKDSIRVLREAGAEDFVVLHCISSYPSKVEDMNVSAVDEISKLGIKVGLSDHSLDNLAAVMSVAYGACVIEKHFTERREDGGPDAAFSLEPTELQSLCDQTFLAWKAKGSGEVLNKKRTGSHHARSVYVVQNIHQGEVLNEANIRIIRPGFGLEPKYYEEVLGKTVNKNIERGMPLSFEDIE